MVKINWHRFFALIVHQTYLRQGFVPYVWHSHTGWKQSTTSILSIGDPCLLHITIHIETGIGQIEEPGPFRAEHTSSLQDHLQ